MQGITISHYVFELNAIPEAEMDHTVLQNRIREFCKALDLHIVKEFDHQFSPYGSSIVFILEESHIGVHSWPEHGYIHIDMVTCCAEMTPLKEVALKASEIFKGKVLKSLEVEY